MSKRNIYAEQGQQNRSKLKRIIIFISTLVIGFFLGSALYQPEQIRRSVAESEAGTVKSLVKENFISDVLADPLKDEKVREDNNEGFQSPSEAIEYLSTLKPEAFSNSTLFRQWQRTFAADPELAYGMLGLLLDIPDPQLKLRLSHVLNNFLIRSDIEPGVVKRPSIDWILDQLKNQNRPTEWLEILSHWGAKTKGSAEYLQEQLPFTYLEQQQEDMLRALAGANNMSYPLISKYSQTEVEQFSIVLAPYLEHDSERIRFAALETLQAFSSDDLAEKLNKAINDDSERIRMKAMEIAVSRKRLVPNLRATMLANIDNSKLRAAERVFSYELAKQLLLNQREYEQIYKFRNETLESLRADAAAESKEIELYRSLYYEF